MDLFTFGLMLSCTGAYAQQQGPTTNFDYLDADVHQIAEAVGAINLKQFIFDQDLKGVVTASCHASISTDGLFFVFMEMLRVNGFATRVSEDKIYVSRPKTDFAEQGARETPDDRHSKVEVLVISTKKWGVEKTKAMILHLLSARGVITEYAPDSILIVSDSRENIESVRAYLGEGTADNKVTTEPNTSRERGNRYTFFDIFIPQPVYVGNEKFIGFRLWPATGSMKFGCLGLKSGDLLVAVDGTPLSSDPLTAQQQSLEKIASEATTVGLTVERGGQKLEMKSQCSN